MMSTFVDQTYAWNSVLHQIRFVRVKLAYAHHENIPI